jgi:nucleoid DNA-binding protein
MSKLTRQQILSFLKKKHSLSNEHASLVLNAFFSTIIDLAQKDGGVLLKNFGKIEFQKKTLEKNIRNFHTKENIIKVVESKRMHFVPSKNLKEKIF